MERSNAKVETLLRRENERQQDILKRKTEKHLANAENEQYSYFNQVFDEKSKEIEVMMRTAPQLGKSEMIDRFDAMYKEVSQLKKFLSDSVKFLRGYDVRVSNEHLQDLEVQVRKLEGLLLPKKKFGFKNKKAKETNTSDVVDGKIRTDPVPVFNDFFGFKNETDAHLRLDCADLDSRDVTLQNLRNSTIVLHGTPTTLQIDSLVDCVLISGPVQTSIFAENCTRTKLVIACQQLRLHKSTDIEIYLHVTSKAIIEDCTGVRVAPYDYDYVGIGDDYEKSGLDRGVNHWDSLDDFNWLVSNKQSPNWAVIDETDRLRDWKEYSNGNKQ